MTHRTDALPKHTTHHSRWLFLLGRNPSAISFTPRERASPSVSPTPSSSHRTAEGAAIFLGKGFNWAEGPAVLPAQGAALGNGLRMRTFRPDGPTFHRTAGPLGRQLGVVGPISPGRRPGLGELRPRWGKWNAYRSAGYGTRSVPATLRTTHGVCLLRGKVEGLGGQVFVAQVTQFNEQTDARPHERAEVGGGQRGPYAVESHEVRQNQDGRNQQDHLP